ncbi:phosphodiester glycosidase family protein [Fluoribacter dumoffii]|uniref:phosphodiester glycosidase family protein n=1 Tax=Fluoribacter dumoffii TaxID=463 RepID=UPI002244B3A1|nr:phosphodiester glycosidase family protein [Fluoribacter dumoffii]MCW8416774.1 phosphodiester glycosidase family protein [Fluoribacter dumoffii]MCW8455386.1 phosphodiester glycosidase family protein [Fluoribacter dumoffii]MCW8460536.1 phosphodiester glycosidase family protein [Fluoribacter dumoffii]MCW8484017.1 phosphodiester glycosidase family protein [Fluoribacter dumoffii]
MFDKRCKTRTDAVNEKIDRIAKSTEIEELRSLPGFEQILSKNPYREHIQGYYVEIPLATYKTFVPNGLKFPDRYGNAYEGGQFDVPLFTLQEWRDNWDKGHPGGDRPDLLVNANWFNIWPTGVPNSKGEKINPRTQARTFLAGLSLSNGELVSTHKVLDQNNVGLDTITFDASTKKVKLIEHSQIDLELEADPKFYDNKNAVSGFIILKDKAQLKTPDLNNNHSNRLPRTGVGYKNNGDTVVVMVVHNTERNHGVTAEEFAELFKALGCTDAINLDNSGSVELFYTGLGEYGKKTVTVQTKTCDSGALTERPKPNCLGFKNASKCTFFAQDDSDIPTRKKSAAPQKTPAKTDDEVTYTYNIKR